MNEPAFPTENILHKGMTLRDYFAAKAMQVSWSMYEKLYDCPPEDVISLVADYAYDLADAMMEARNATQ
jgi:hypothetical protein